ncbi:MAG TPA: carbohydrate ABC transporter permease, partial [Geminicoccus sp.]|nr:carbohydrate ABC transporter permease [Geminicoccus sp.]
MKTSATSDLRAQRLALQQRRRSRAVRIEIVKQICMILASFAMLYPLLWMIASSFKPDTIIFSELSLWPSEWKFTNYRDGWDALRVTFTTFYLNSFVIAILSVIGNLVACSLTAYAFARLDFRFKNLWFALMLGTLMLPYHVTLVPQYVLFLNIGWVDTILPLVVPKFLAHDAFFIFL